MIKVCTNCQKGAYNYADEKLYCDGEIKNPQTNTACSEWSEKEPTCYITHQGWVRFKRGYHGY